MNLRTRVALDREAQRSAYKRGTRHLAYEPLQSLILGRILQGISQEEVAQRMGVNLATIRQFENYSDVRLSTTRRYALVVKTRITHDVIPIN